MEVEVSTGCNLMLLIVTNSSLIREEGTLLLGLLGNGAQ